MSSKSWQRPWTIEEIIKNAPNWSLAGDAGLLKYLELFSENLLSKADATNNNLNELLSRLNSTGLTLEEVKNDFRSLRNTQFIESRVYEDDETVSESQEESVTEKPENESQSEESKAQDMKDAILAGIAVVEKYFDRVEVPGSDSEDETDLPNFILKPKDPYADRPLPYLIGSDEWYKKWHVGLLDSSSDSEHDKVSEQFSESDSEDDIKDNVVNHPVPNATFHEELKTDLFSGSDAEDISTPNYLSPANTKFANELAAKLGNFVDEHQNLEEQVNKRPITKAPQIQNFGNLFSDEPPPIDDFNDNNNVTGLFSGGEGLFDDIDNGANLWNEDKKIKAENKKTKSKITSLFEDDLEDELFNNTVGNEKAKGNNDNRIKNVGLFDEEDDEIFNNNFTNLKENTPYLQANLKVTMPFIADEPPEFKPKVSLDSDAKSKKPVGGVKIMENTDTLNQQKLGSFLKQRRQNSSSSESDAKPDPVTVDKTPTKKKTISLFDDDDEDDDFEKDLFATHYPRKEVKVNDYPEKESPKTVTASISDNLDESKKNNSVVSESKEPERKMISLFGEDDYENKPDDLFSDGLFSAKPQAQSKTLVEDSLHVPPLFDSNPPELDDNWDYRSDHNLFDDNDTGLFDNIPEMSSHRSGLFDNEPPSLFFESSGIVRDISTRATSDESFSPYASSSKRFSADIFHEQQSNDCFFITKNEVQSNLEIIPEVFDSHTKDSSESKIEITPSGVEDDLFSDSLAASSNATITVDETKISDPSKNSTLTSKDSPGKLKHDLKINVRALIPGASPPKKQTVEKTIDSELPSTEEENVKQLSLKPSEDPSSFENVVKDVEVLPSITKARAKIPFKRIPSTRRARQESIRNSVPDFKILNTNSEENTGEASIIPQSKSDEFIDIFSEEASVATGLKSGELFVDKEKTDLLSLAKNVVSVEEVNKKAPDNFSSKESNQLNLFDDSEDFDEIFSTKKLPPKSNILSKSLFDDEFDDDDDVFSTPIKKNISNTDVNKSVQKRSAMTAPVKKLENSEVVEDPLSLFLEE